VFTPLRTHDGQDIHNGLVLSHIHMQIANDSMSPNITFTATTHTAEPELKDSFSLLSSVTPTFNFQFSPNDSREPVLNKNDTQRQNAWSKVLRYMPFWAFHLVGKHSPDDLFQTLVPRDSWFIKNISHFCKFGEDMVNTFMFGLESEDVSNRRDQFFGYVSHWLRWQSNSADVVFVGYQAQSFRLSSKLILCFPVVHSLFSVTDFQCET
jgi:hypothetical protein